MTKPLLDIYADLHSIAEPAWNEHKTAAYIANYLKSLPGFEVQTGLAGGTGVVAVMKGKLMFVVVADDNSFFAFSAASFNL